MGFVISCPTAIYMKMSSSIFVKIKVIPKDLLSDDFVISVISRKFSIHA